MLDAVLRANLGTMDRYLLALMSVIWNDISPEDAIGMIEMPS